MNIPTHLFVLGIDHQRAPVSIREKLSFPSSKLRETLQHLLSFDGIEGGVILSTCNRSEIYFSTPSRLFSIENFKKFLTDFQSIDLEDISPYLYNFRNVDVAEHLFRVSSGLESQLLGENEILGQVKRAYLAAKEIKATDVTTEKIFEEAVKIGKKVRKETRISQGSTSLSSMAIKLAEKKFNLRDQTILLVGVNKINEQIAKYLYERNIQTVIVANRTYEKAVKIAQYLGGKAIHFDQFKKELYKVDIIISSTAAPHIVLKREELETSLKKRNREILLIDIAVPRDIDPDIKGLKSAILYNLDDFNQVIEENLDKKKEEALKAERLIKRAVEKISFLAEPLTSLCQPNESTV
ncbi:MAG: glutamyl-tRNA reductase [Deltaproteobacteria bacterium]|jgi:glutamyl-tRNA reductase|nr:glutamyl-tRNA reductase [Deltaproteobacteria bacterium]MCK5185708.1 glutamyl-tRNA reductase [Deltaproteobacteria bacterium]MCK5513976.1 glutamyl-tRNA reductase [Deltaproteobacteria bacterium]NOQ87169.1 glutamyl-tRNA reductase [Deltaproteobacteria bacterium]